MQNLVILMEPSEVADDISLKGANMYFNRFCVDEDAAFELSGVHYLAKLFDPYCEDEFKGKGYSSWLFTI